MPSLLLPELPFTASAGPLWSTDAQGSGSWAVLQVRPCGKGPASRTAKVCNVCPGLHLRKLSSYLGPSSYWRLAAVYSKVMAIRQDSEVRGVPSTPMP